MATSINDQIKKSQLCLKCEISIKDTFKIYERDIQQLQYLLNYKELALRRRDEMLSNYIEEINKLKDQIKKMDKYAYRLELQIPDPKKLSYNEEVNKSKQRPFSSNQLMTHARLYSGKSKDGISSPVLRPTKINENNKITVTENQGLHSNQSLFADRHGKYTILTEEEDRRIFKNPKFKQMEEFFLKEENYLEAFNVCKNSIKSDLLDTTASLLSDFKNTMNLTLRLKKLIKCFQTISTSLILDNAINAIVKETCDNINCDRATVFILDEENKELWSKVAKDSSHIRIPLSKGIVGHVATNNVNIKIDDAYSDTRFNKDIDKKNNYHTKTILCVPIKDTESKVIGVIQAINKLNGYFNSDDEGILSIISNQAGLMIKNSMIYDKAVTNQYKLFKLMDIGVTLFESNSLESLLINGEKKIKDLLNTDQTAIFYKNEDHFTRFFQNKPSVNFPDTGIIGEVAKSGLFIEITDPYLHHSYNQIIDLQTHLPLYTYPIKSTEQKIIGVCQMVRIHEIFGKKSKKNTTDDDILNFFLKIYGFCLEKINK